MNFKILVFGAEWNKKTACLGDILRFMFKGNLPVGKEVAYYESINEALPEFSTRFQGTDVVLLLADISDYANSKQLLARALRLPLRSSPEISKNTRAAIGDFEPGSKEMMMHCMVPADKPTFCLGDGLYAGFAVTAGNQNMIFLPHDLERTVTLLNQQVIPYLNSFYGSTMATDMSLRFYAKELCALLGEHEEKMGVSGTKTAVFIRNAAEKLPDFPQMLRFTPSAETRGNLHPVEYAANLSIAACELEGLPFGAAMTSAFFTGSEANADTQKCVYIAFTDDNDTGVREVYSTNGEEIPDFLNRCTEELFKFAIERIRAMYNPAEQQKVKSDSALSGGKKALLAIVAILAIAVSFGVSFFVTNRVLEKQQQPDVDSGVSEQAQQPAVGSDQTQQPTNATLVG